MDKKVRISESNLRNMIGECIVEVLNEGIFDTVKQKLGDYYRGFSQKDPSEVSTPDEFFANCGWDVKGSQESTKRPGATNYLLVRKTGTFGAFNGTEVQDLVADFNEKFGGQLFSPFIKLIPPTPFVYTTSLLLLGIGVLVGMFGSWRAVRKHLKI